VSAPGGQLALFGSEEAVVLRRSARARRLSLRVFPHGVVEVIAPLRAGRRSIEQFVRSNQGWIAKARGQFLALHGSLGFAPPAEIILAAISECWQVEHVEGPAGLVPQAAPGGGRLRLCGPGDAQWRRSRLRAWLMARARETLPPWLDIVSAETGLAYTRVSIRRQRSRWGSCSAGRAISLNCALLFLEPGLVRHLLVHELAHTRHLNHSNAFWRLVAKLDPEYETLDAQLRDAWQSVPAWVSYDPP
jgi:predicted metal-dependent hydrolase